MNPEMENTPFWSQKGLLYQSYMSVCTLFCPLLKVGKVQQSATFNRKLKCSGCKQILHKWFMQYYSLRNNLQSGWEGQVQKYIVKFYSWFFFLSLEQKLHWGTTKKTCEFFSLVPQDGKISSSWYQTDMKLHWHTAAVGESDPWVCVCLCVRVCACMHVRACAQASIHDSISSYYSPHEYASVCVWDG